MIINTISIPKKVINLYISYILSSWLRNLKTDFTLNNCLYVSVELTSMLIQINTSIVAMVSTWLSFRISIYRWKHGKKVIFGADMNTSIHIDNTNKDILIVSEKQTHESDDKH